MKLCPVEINGSPWDEDGNCEVVQILISYDVSKIHSIQFAYAQTTEGSHSSPIYGKPTGREFKSVVFDYPSEFLTSVSGKYVKDGDFNRLFSITFDTTRRTYGPFGTSAMVFHDLDDYHDMADVEIPVTEFKYEFGARDFGGFHGSVFDSYICCIGVHVKPVQPLNSTGVHVKPVQTLNSTST